MALNVGIKGGTRILENLRRIQRQLGSGSGVRIGYLENATYDDGTPVAYIAAVNEWGATIEREPYEQTITRSVNLKTGAFNKMGKFVKAGKGNYQTTHHVGEYTIKIPARPSFRTMISTYSPEWGGNMAKLLRNNNYDGIKCLGLMGARIKGQLQQTIVEFKDPPNAPSTIAQKGFNDPLIWSNHMRNSVDYEVLL